MHATRDPKALAKSLRQALAERQIQITHSDSLEIVARQYGWRDWNTLAAQLDRPTLHVPAGWHPSGSQRDDYDMGHDPAQACAVIRYRFGNFDAVPSREPGFGTLMQSVRAEAYRGKRIRLAASLKADGITGAGTIWLRVDNASGRSIAFDNMETRSTDGPLVGTVGWQERSIVLDVSEDAQSLNFGFYLRGMGSLWARRFRLEDVDASVRVTNTDGDRVRPTPTNLDFAVTT